MKNSTQEQIAFLIQVLERPAMYGIERVEDFKLFLLGYERALGESIDEKFVDFWGGFSDFLLEESMPKGTHWSRIIRFYSGGDHHSLELLRLKVEAYQEQKQDR